MQNGEAEEDGDEGDPEDVRVYATSVTQDMDSEVGCHELKVVGVGGRGGVRRP